MAKLGIHASGSSDFVTFESFSSDVADADLSITCAIRRNVWSDDIPLARHAKTAIELEMDEARRKAGAGRTS